MQLATLYLIHFLVFAVVTIITFSIDVKTAGAECPDDPEGKEGGTGGLESMLMLASYAYIGCTGLSLFVFVLLKYYSGSFLPGEFGSLGRLKSCGGCLLRLFTQLLTFAHWFILVPDAMFLLTYMTGSACFLEKLGT